MARQKQASYLIFIIFSFISILVAILFFLISYSKAKTDRSIELKNNSYILGEWINEYFQSNRFILEKMRMQLPSEEIHYPPENISIYKSYTRMLNLISSSFPHTAFSGVIDMNGILSYSTSVDGFDLSDNTFFKEMKDNPETKYIISSAFKSPEGYLLIAQGLNYELINNEFTAMVIIAINLESFAEWISKLDYEGSGLITIIDSEGILLANNSENHSAIGEKYSGFENILLPDNNNEYLEYSPGYKFNIKAGYTGSRKIADLPLYIIIEDESYPLSDIWFTLFIILLSLVIVHILGVFILNAHLSQLKTNSELQEALNELDIYFSNSLIGIVILRGGRKIYRVNRRIADIFGYDDPDYLKGKLVEEFHISKENAEEFGQKYYQALINREVIQVEYPFKHKNGSHIWMSVSGKAIDQNDPPDPDKGVVWIFEDISERREASLKLKEMASTDFLTGLYNRRYFMHLGEREFSIYQRSGRKLSVLMFDLDNFKMINDIHGHSTGDKALKHFAQICRENLRSQDIAGRLGGEEFSVILPDTDLEKAFLAAERIRLRTETSTVKNTEGIPGLTVSIGIAADEPDGSLEKTLQHADSALYRAKNSGRNKVVIYSADKKPQ